MNDDMIIALAHSRNHTHNQDLILDLASGGVHTEADLFEVLPAQVHARITPKMVETSTTAAALRLLATAGNTAWCHHVKDGLIDWQPIVTLARDRHQHISNGSRCALEMAASLGGYPHAHVNLLYAVQCMPYHQILAVMDALRITKQGVSK